jgi:hypothetical protein
MSGGTPTNQRFHIGGKLPDHPAKNRCTASAGSCRGKRSL